MFYVYILKSQSLGVFYKGITEDPEKRLWEHNNELSRYTKDKGPWEMLYLVMYESKKQALIEEKRIKKLNSASIERLIISNKNILNQ
jgi:putative endonuclease